MDKAEWNWEVTAIPMDLPLLGRYNIVLVREDSALVYGGNDGWGWTAWTLAGAIRKGERELKKKIAADLKLSVRQAMVQQATVDR